MRSGQPAPGLEIYFEPVRTQAGEDDRALIMAWSSPTGDFTLYSGAFPGAPAGPYKVGIRDETGLPVAMPDDLILTVEEKDSNEFKIDF